MVDFRRQQFTRIRRQNFGNANGAGVRAMRHRKRVVDKDIIPVGQFLGKFGVIFFFARVKAHIFQQRHIPVTHPAQEIFVQTIGNQRHIHIFRNRFQRIFHIARSLGPAQVRHNHHARTRITQRVNGRHALFNTKRVRDFPIHNLYVEIIAQQYILAPQIQVINCP